MNRFIYAPSPRCSPLEEIIYMIERRAPMLMRAHLGTVSQRSGPYRLTSDDVRDIRQRAARGESLYDIARDYGVHYQTVADHTRDIRAARRAVAGH